MRRAFILAVLLVSLNSIGSLPALAGANGDPTEAVGNFIDQNIGLTSRPFTLAQLRLHLHATTKSSRKVENIHVAGQMDRIVVLNDGKGTEVEAYVPATGPVLIQRITVTSAERKLPAGLAIGRTSPDDMYKALGADAQNEKGPGGAFARRYHNVEQTFSALLWFDQHERLAGVEWSFPAD
jgi:hypothetical protein